MAAKSKTTKKTAAKRKPRKKTAQKSWLNQHWPQLVGL
jgi:S-DNA-T family DNA segregation ATPase FtsK/SpoIIIE